MNILPVVNRPHPSHSTLDDEVVNRNFIKEYQEFLARNEVPEFKELKIRVEDLLDIELTEFMQRKLEHWYENVSSYKFLKDFISEVDFNEVIFHSESQIQVDQGDGLSCWEHEGLSRENYQLALETMALKHQISWNYTDSFASFQVTLNGQKFRATLTHYELSPYKVSKLFLRKSSQRTPDLESFSIAPETKVMLQTFMKDKKNILISGATGSGKTTFIRSLLQEINESEHVVVLEDTHEIPAVHEGFTHLLSREMPGKSLKEYCAYAMRMRPDRIILGEMRSSEVVPFLLAMNTGHKGLMSTLHANSSSDALKRVAQLFCLSQGGTIDYSLVLKLVCTNVDVAIHLENKRVREVIEVLGAEGDQVYFNHLSSTE